nr:hypothetical protein [Tanacetum cinerariifolium]
MVFMAQTEKVLSDSDESSSSAKETIADVAYYTFEFESESEFETSEYYDNSTNYGFFVNNVDDQEIFYDAIEFGSENFNENHIDSQKDCDESEVDHNDSKAKDHLSDKLIQKFNHKITNCQKHIKNANQQSKDLQNQNKDLQDKYDVLINQVNAFEEKNNKFNKQMKVLKEKNADLLAQTEILNEQLKVKHVVIDTHAEYDKKIIITEASIRRDLQFADEEGVDCLPNSTIFKQLALMWKPTRKVTQVHQPGDPIEHVIDEAVHKELSESLVRAATTASSLRAEQEGGNIAKTQSKVTPNKSSSQGTDSGGGPRGNTLQSNGDRLELNELMALCTNLQTRVLEMEKTKTTQQNEIDSLKRRVKKLETRNRSRTHKLKRLYARVESSRDE